jgi:hypothetical protein
MSRSPLQLALRPFVLSPSCVPSLFQPNHHTPKDSRRAKSVEHVRPRAHGHDHATVRPTHHKSPSPNSQPPQEVISNIESSLRWAIAEAMVTPICPSQAWRVEGHAENAVRFATYLTEQSASSRVLLRKTSASSKHAARAGNSCVTAGSPAPRGGSKARQRTPSAASVR